MIQVLQFHAKSNTYRYRGCTLDSYHRMPRCSVDGCGQSLQVLLDQNGYGIGCPIHGKILLDCSRKLKNPTEFVVAYYTQLVNALSAKNQSDPTSSVT